MIKAENIWKSFGKHPVVEDVSFSIEQGTVYGLVGLNGAGKTTLLRLLLGLLKPDKGSVHLLSQLSCNDMSLLYKRCGVVLEHDGFWGNLSILENLAFYADAKGLEHAQVKRYLDELWHDTGLLSIKKKVKHLSRGQKMQCALCRAFMGDPEVLFLDEPLIALDMQANAHLCMLIKNARNRGAAVLVSSHQLELVDAVCDRVGILDNKKLVEMQRSKSVSWVIQTDNNPQWKLTLCECGANDVEFYDNRWIFHLDNDDMIADCIAGLVSKGCRILGAFKLSDDFSNVIRSAYNR